MISKAKNRVTNRLEGNKLSVRFSKSEQFFEWLPSLINYPLQITIVVILALGLYANTIPNKYALDDQIVLVENLHVQKGIRGITDILVRADFKNDYGNELLRKRYYRQLSIVTFAIEQEFFGDNPHVSHFINILLYALTGVVLLMFLRKFLFSPDLAFLITILFISHPIHTEVVANIKSRDEIFCFLFCLLALFYCCKATESANQAKNWQNWLWIAVFFFLGLLSKENAIVFMGTVPLTLYFFSNARLKDHIKALIPFVLMLIVYFLFRAKAIGIDTSVNYADILHNRYFNSVFSEKYATIAYVLGFYIWILFLPLKLYWDYSYAHIPMYNFDQPLVWLSIIINVGLLGWALWKIKYKNPIAYGILWYFGLLFIVSNVIINIGGYVAERFLYQPSLGFCIAVSIGSLKLLDRLNLLSLSAKKATLYLCLTGFLAFSSWRTVIRNFDWKDHYSLYTSAIRDGTNSALANKAYASYIFSQQDTIKDEAIKRKIWDQSLVYFNKAIAIHPRYEAAHLSAGYVYLLKDSLEKAAYHWGIAHEILGDNPVMNEYDDLLSSRWLDSANKAFHRKDTLSYIYWSEKALPFCRNKQEVSLNIALMYRDIRKPEKAIPYLKKAIDLNPVQPDYWFELGRLYIATRDLKAAKSAFEKTIQLKPGHPGATYFLNNAPPDSIINKK